MISRPWGRVALACACADGQRDLDRPTPAGVVAGLLATLVVEEDARAQLEARYLAGQSSLLPDAEAAWDRFGEMVDRMWSMAENLRMTAAENRRVSKDGHRLYEERVAGRARTLADNARITTLDRLGENQHALRILERRLAGS